MMSSWILSRRSVALVTVALVLGLVACRSQAVQPPGVDGGPMVVVSDLDNMPFAGVDESGKAVGRDVEMMEALGRRLGRPVVWERRPFDELLPALRSGEADVLCATMGITAERAERVLFTEPYFRTTLAVVVRVGAGEPQSLKALRGCRVSAGAGTTSEVAVRRMWLVDGVYENKSGLPTADRLLSGEVDAAVMDGPAAEALVRRSGGSLTRLAEDVGIERYALALPKSHTRLCAQLSTELARMEDAGMLKTLNQTHGLHTHP